MKKDYDGTALSSRLRSLMHENETTQQKLAELLNISRQSVAQYLDSSAQPSIDKLYKLAEYFDCSTDYLLGASPYRNFQEWSELQDATVDGEDGKNISHFGMGLYRSFKEFSDAINNLNNELGHAASVDTFLISDTLHTNLYWIIDAYKTAIDNFGDVFSNRTEESELIKTLINDIRQADKSGIFIAQLLEHIKKLR